MKLTIAGVEYRTKKMAKQFVKSVVDSIIGWEVRETSEHFGLLMSLWQRSPSLVPGDVYFVIGAKFASAAIKAITGDGIMIDWSLRSAISGKDVSRWTKLTQALRGAIRPQMQKFRGAGSGKCELCDFNGFCEVDHLKSFKSLMREYLDLRGFYPENYEYAHSGWCFKPEDWEFEANWQQFHQERCSLRLLCHECHLGVTQRQRGDSESE
jgi:hypothetical protein